MNILNGYLIAGNGARTCFVRAALGVLVAAAVVGFAAPALAEPTPSSSVPYPAYQLNDGFDFQVSDTLYFGTFSGQPIQWEVTAVDPGNSRIDVRTTSAVDVPDHPASAWNESLLRRWLNGVAAGQFAHVSGFSSSDYRALVPMTNRFGSVTSIDRFMVASFDDATAYTVATIEARLDLRLLEMDENDPSLVSGTGTPHGGYSSTTNKCASCHSTHQAAAESVVLGDGQPEFLLATSAANACTYCHIDVSNRSDVKVYGGDAANYWTTGSYETTSSAHRSIVVGGVQTGVTCVECHVVHGATSEMTGNPYLDVNLLRIAGVETTNPPLATDTPELALSKWCVQCHADASADAPHMGMDMLAGSSYEQGDSSYDGRVAWQDVTGCTSCHAAGTDGSAFPHYVEGAADFLVSAASASSETTYAQSPTEDGVCLRCHRETETSGIGFQY